jgi:ATP-dependent DNA helicase RecG
MGDVERTAASPTATTVDAVRTDRLRVALAREVGPRTAGPLNKLGLQTVGDLLAHLPRRYADPGRLTDLSSLAVGDHVTVLARVVQTTVSRMRSRPGYIASSRVTDGTGQELDLTFFAKNQGSARYHERELVPGRTGLFTGTVGEYRRRRQLAHPDYQVFGESQGDRETEAALAEAAKPIPIYPSSAAIASWKIHTCVRAVLDTLTEGDVPDPLPPDVLAKRRLVGRLQALRDVHDPGSDAEWQRGRRRLRFEEAFVLQVALAQRRAATGKVQAQARPLPAGPGLLADLDAALPFALTQGQREVGEQIAADLAAARPMQRLLQGEVGSGKTVVALRAMLQVVDAGGQAALLAPTEVLAAQHARSLRALLGPLGEAGTLGSSERATKVALLTGSLTSGARKQALLDAASGAAGIVVGTHALLGEKVQFADLGLVVVDEQHRFGVEQRDALRAKGRDHPHMLVMTATPIPRTVAMTVFGDLETSTLSEIPAGRSGTVTHLVPASYPAWMRRTWDRAREEVDAGHRVFVVAPRIDADDEADPARPAGDEDVVGDPLDGVEGAGTSATSSTARASLRAVLEVADELRANPALAGVRIGVLHGRTPSAEAEAAMSDFVSGVVPVLVATTVVEVGVDVPDATVMVVLDADRFGISQLHQLRGRVGRGAASGLCLLVSDAEPGTPARVRLEALEASSDGFELADVDLELRREGDVLGAAQSGRASSLQLLRVLGDGEVIADARVDATAVVDDDPALERNPALAEAIRDRLDPEREQFLQRA